MMHVFACPKCGKQLKAPAETVGRKSKCPHCGTIITVPAAAVEDVPVAQPDLEVTETRVRPRRPVVSREQAPEVPPPRFSRRVRSRMEEAGEATGKKALNGLGVASLIIGIVILLFAWIPCVGPFTIFFSVIGLILGLVGLVIAISGKKWGIGSPIAGIGLNVLAIIVPIVVIWIMVSLPSTPSETIAEADGLYQEGKHAEAVTIYKEHFTSALEKPQVLKRIVEVEIQQGNKAEAKKWIEKGLDDQIIVTYDSPAAREMLADAKKKRGFVNALTEDDGKKPRQDDPVPNPRPKEDRAGKVQNALAQYRTAMDKKPSDVAGAARALNIAAALEPENPEVIGAKQELARQLVVTGRAALDANKLDEANRTLADAKRLAPQDLDVLQALKELEQARKKAEDAPFAVTVQPRTLQLRPGMRGTITVNIDRKNYDGPVKVELRKLPIGMMAMPPFTTIPAGQNSKTIDLTGGVRPGSTEIEVLASTFGGPDAETVFTPVTVTIQR